LGETARFPVEINEGLGLGLVEIKTLVDGVGGVIVTLDDVSPTVFTGPRAGLSPRGLEVGTTVATDAPGRKTGKNEVAGHDKVNHHVKWAGLGDLVQGDCLGNRARESVKDVATVAGIISLNPLGHEANHDFIAHQVAGVDDCLGHKPKLGSLTNSSTQHVAC
jgi:hypothetical protein